MVNYIYYFFITWFPAYLMHERGMELMTMGMVAAIPSIVAIFGEMFGGWVSDKLYMAGWSLTKARKTNLIIGMILATAVGFAGNVESDVLVIVLLSISSFGCVFAAAAIWSLPGDVAPKNMVSQVAGLQNCVSNMGGAIGPLVTGFIIATTHSFQISLYISGALAFIAILIYAFYLGEVKQIEVPAKE